MRLVLLPSVGSGASDNAPIEGRYGGPGLQDPDGSYQGPWVARWIAYWIDGPTTADVIGWTADGTNRRRLFVEHVERANDPAPGESCARPTERGAIACDGWCEIRPDGAARELAAAAWRASQGIRSDQDAREIARAGDRARARLGLGIGADELRRRGAAARRRRDDDDDEG